MVAAAQRPARATVTIDLAAVAANVELLRGRTGGAELWAVVKADGYGHGASSVGAAALAAGATRLCVATWEEARAVRAELPQAPVLVMGPLTPGEEAEVEGVDVAIPSMEAFARLLRIVPLWSVVHPTTRSADCETEIEPHWVATRP